MTFNTTKLLINDYLVRFPKIKTHKKVRLKTKLNPGFINFLSFFTISCILITTVRCNRPPRFILEDGHSEIVLRLKEGPETPVGSLIYQLKGYDPDDDPLTFSVKPSSDAEIIKIVNTGKTEANIVLAKELDRETKSEYSIILTLSDNQFENENYVTQSLLLLVEDVNDNAPIFKPYQSAIEILEDSPPGIITTLEATDRDEGAYGQVVYYLQELSGDNDIFSISTYQGKGILRLIKPHLDYERKNLYQLRILAIDRANRGPVNTGTAAIIIKIRDVEDQPPEFVHVPPVTRIPEDANVGSQVLYVKAIDGDRGVNNRIKYAIEKTKNHLFEIEEDTGIVFTTKKLDREDTRNQIDGAYILKILAIEITKINPPPYAKTEVTIIVTDVNDETPTFREVQYRCEINENAQQNTPLTFLDDVRNEVYDHDLGKNGTFQLYLDPPNEIFEIAPSLAVNEATFIIRVKDSRMLDYEKIVELNFTIVAREIAEPRKWSLASLQVIVRDQNDNFPEFITNIYEVSIPENCDVGTTIARVEAIDEDSGDFGTMGIRYTSLRGGIANLLFLDPITGIVTVKSTEGNVFDREIISRHYLTVEARDNVGKGNRNTVQLIINLDDVNDNSPIFLQRKFEAKLLENKINFETPLVLEARDADLNNTANSEIVYEIIDGTLKQNFTIDSKTGIISLRNYIDFEELNSSEGFSSTRTIHLIAKARDNGIPSLFSKVPVIIYVQDVNDNSPAFQKRLYTKTIPEDLPGGSAVIEVKAIDLDGSSPNNHVVYRIQSGASDKFVIDSETGFIFVAPGASLDPDLSNPKKMLYSLIVVAIDGGLGTQLTDTTLVNITIKDVNNKKPFLKDIESLRILENIPVGTVVHQLNATDLDESPILRYQLDKKNSEARTEEGTFVKQNEYDFVGVFELNALNGVLKVVRLLDREKVEHIKLGIIVQDLAAAGESQISMSFLNIIVEDVNDNNPKFKMPYYKRSITENSMNGVTIVNVLASDVDKNKTITYSLEGDRNVLDLLHLDSETGEIIVANRIDHELYQWLNFSVKATDSGVPSRSALVDVFVNVLDENDNNPYFVTNTKNFSVSENVQIGTRVGIIQANDADSGDFGKITFLMDRISSQGKFSIDADTGVLSVSDKLDRETKDLYVLIIEAWDNYQFGYLAGESRNAFKQIFVNILDENDSPPEVTIPEGCVQITEYHDPNEPIITINGRDADDPHLPNGKIQYSISNGNDQELFRITQNDAWIAQIWATKSLKNRYGNYSLTISARDLGVPPNIVTKHLDICVADFNDHPPVFVSPSHNITIRVPENTTIGTTIIQVHAIDEDIGINANVKYRLKSDPLGNYRTFEINEDTGEIILKKEFDREKQKIYEIRVEAYDQGIPTSLSSDLDLMIYVRNVNEYEPQFLVDEIAVNFTEHSSPGEEKIKLPDTIDRDEVDELDDPPSSVCYYIIYGNEKDIFYLDPETHILQTRIELDREAQANYTLYVRATENCSESSNFSRKNSTLKNLQFESDFNEIPTKLQRQARRSNNGKFLNLINKYKHLRTIRSIRNYNDETLMEDSTVVRVQIRVIDINDNPPKFISKIFTGGITTNADFGIKFMQIQANDPDEGENAKITYHQIGDIRQTLSEGLENVGKHPFLVDKKTGFIQLNFDPQKGMKGYFDFMVLAKDKDDHQDTAHVFIYLLREDQKVRFVFRQQPPILRDKINLFRDALSNVTNAIVNVDEFKIHENKDGSVDKTKTDLYLHFVNRRDNSILEVSEVLKLIDENISELDELFKKFNVLDTQPAESQFLISDVMGKGSMLIWLVFSNIFITSLLVVTIALCVTQRANYKRQLRAAKVNILGHPPTDLMRRDSVSRVPNTNKHSVEGSNPIWMKAYENEWLKTDDNLSQNEADNSLDDNTLSIDNTPYATKKLFDKPNDLNRHFNVYHQIDKLAGNVQALAKKLETTEL